MWNEPTKERLSKIPRLYETEGIPVAEKRVHLHFFIGGCDWWVVEFDGEDTFFGFVNLGDDLNAEWGYFSFRELREIRVSGFEVDCEKEEHKISRLGILNLKGVPEGLRGLGDKDLVTMKEPQDEKGEGEMKYTVTLTVEDLRCLARRETDLVLEKIFAQIDREALPVDLQEIASCLDVPST